jgi:hypothetical protein
MFRQESTKSKARRRKQAQKTKQAVITERAKRAQPVKGKAAPKKASTAADRAKFAPGRGGLGALSRKVKAQKKARKTHDYSKGPRKSKKYGTGWGIKPKG